MASSVTPEPTTTAGSEEVYVADIDQQDHDDALSAGDITETPELTGTETDPGVAPEGSQPPTGVTLDAEGRWRTADGKFAAQQPSKEAAAAVKAASAPAPAKAAPNGPWKPNIYGTEKEVFKGALRSPEGHVFIPRDQVGSLTALVARGEKYADVQTLRQDQAKSREEFRLKEEGYLKRIAFEGEEFTKILTGTLLDGDWLAAASQNPHMAIQQVRLMLQEANLTSKEQFGPLAKPTPAEAPAPEPLDRYEGEGAITTFLSELAGTPDYQGKWQITDTDAILATLRQHDVPLFFYDEKQGWMLDERPVQMAVASHWKARPAPKVTTPTPANRNAAAIPATPAAPAASPKKPSADKDPYVERPWENPELSFHKRRELWRKNQGYGP